jgi:hypothetical protein
MSKAGASAFDGYRRVRRNAGHNVAQQGQPGVAPRRFALMVGREKRNAA